ncbi:uncharacterized protein LOC125588410 [Brassica napus]|uniref:uncharacterized protein LOC125588410 n=1 Tax=Brassica napus TaxID=3708 RepID=UPI00207A174B|nr:uncharacterized protein LOC125588410 [Brassica napus]
MTRETWIWNREALMKYLSNLMDNILLLQSSTTGAEDGYAWLLNPSREYSSKTGYLALHLEDATTHRTPNIPDDFNWFKSVWNTQLLHKIQIFLWKVLQNAIPTGENLQKRRVLTNTTCVRCGVQETTLHLFFHCEFTKQVWNFAPWSSRFDADEATSFGSELQPSCHRINLPPSGISINLFPCIIWAIWTSRNLLIFQNRSLNPISTISKAIVASREWSLAQTLSPPSMTRSLPPTVQPTSTLSTTILCYTDASWIASTKHAGIAWIFTDPTKKELNRGSLFKDHISSPLLAESLAIRASMLYASSFGFTNIWIHSDSQELVRAINEKRRSTELFGIWSNIESLSLSFSF